MPTARTRIHLFTPINGGDLIKRLFDVVVSASLLLLTSPVFLATAVAIRLGSSGPVLFRQTRVGRNGVLFDIVKFRTMVVDADRSGLALTTADDARVTRVGAWLRRTKLDELPQLLNVLRGEMSLVGPRPEVPQYVALYTPAQREVLSVRPGITGISQVEMRDEEALLEGVDDVEAAYLQRIMPAKLQRDLSYIRRQTLALDLAVLLRTAFRLSDVPRERRAAFATGWYLKSQRYRAVQVLLAQCGVAALSNYAAFLLRFDGAVPAVETALFWQTLPWLLVIRGIAFAMFRLHQGLWRYTSIHDLRLLLAGVLVSSAGFGVYVRAALGPAAGYPRSVIFIDAAVLVLVLGGVRLVRRILTEVSTPGRPEGRLLIYGAGDTGEMLVRDMRQHPSAGLHPIGFVDDDPRKVGKSIHGVKVLGTSGQLTDIVTRHQPTTVVLAMPSAAPERLRTIAGAFEPFNLSVRVVPNLQMLLGDGGVVDQATSYRGHTRSATLPRAIGASCPTCAAGMLLRSKSRHPLERLRKRFTSLRLHRCGACGWRGWHQPIEATHMALGSAPAPLDLSVLDRLSLPSALVSDGLSPRDL